MAASAAGTMAAGAAAGVARTPVKFHCSCGQEVVMSSEFWVKDPPFGEVAQQSIMEGLHHSFFKRVYVPNPFEMDASGRGVPQDHKCTSKRREMLVDLPVGDDLIRFGFHHTDLFGDMMQFNVKFAFVHSADGGKLPDLEDADQASTDADQAGTDADQAGTDADQAGTDADQAGTDADQASTGAARAGAADAGADVDPVCEKCKMSPPIKFYGSTCMLCMLKRRKIVDSMVQLLDMSEAQMLIRLEAGETADDVGKEYATLVRLTSLTDLIVGHENVERIMVMKARLLAAALEVADERMA
jgi:hypothetical protein